MHYMILLYSDETQVPDFAPGSPEFEAMMGEWMSFNQSLIDAGQFIEGSALAPTEAATVVTKSFGGSTAVTDGPYAETKEQLGGFYLVEASDLDAAIEIANRVPIPAGSFEIRPVGFRPSADGDPRPA